MGLLHGHLRLAVGHRLAVQDFTSVPLVQRQTSSEVSLIESCVADGACVCAQSTGTLVEQRHQPAVSADDGKLFGLDVAALGLPAWGFYALVGKKALKTHVNINRRVDERQKIMLLRITAYRKSTGHPNS
jgi:hypothetical protein